MPWRTKSPGAQSDRIQDHKEGLGPPRGKITGSGSARAVPREQRTFEMPPWLGIEVTGQRGYYNSALAIRPHCLWSGRRDAERIA